MRWQGALRMRDFSHVTATRFKLALISLSLGHLHRARSMSSIVEQHVVEVLAHIHTRAAGPASEQHAESVLGAYPVPLTHQQTLEMS